MANPTNKNDGSSLMLFERQLARKPDLYPWTKPYIKAMRDGFWTAEKFTFDSDATDFELNLTEDQRLMVTSALAAIAQIEIQVKTFWSHLGDHLQHPSITDMGITMANVEVIHNDAYEKLLEKLGLSDVFQKNMNVPAIAGRVNYLTKHNTKVYGDDRKQYIYSLILFTLFVENVSLFSQFYVILWLNRFSNVLKDAAQQVKYTRNEEQLHGMAGSQIINTLRVEYPELFDAELEARVLEESRVAYEAEAKLIDWMVGAGHYTGTDAEGNERYLNASTLKTYVAERLNESLAGIGYGGSHFVVSKEEQANNFWMTEGLFAEGKVDFFHGEPIGYQQADTALDDDF